MFVATLIVYHGFLVLPKTQFHKNFVTPKLTVTQRVNKKIVKCSLAGLLNNGYFLIILIKWRKVEF